MEQMIWIAVWLFLGWWSTKLLMKERANPLGFVLMLCGPANFVTLFLEWAMERDFMCKGAEFVFGGKKENPHE